MPSSDRPSSSNIAFVLESQDKFKYETRPEPQIESPDDVIVAIKYTGICGSDVHYWTHGRIGDCVVTSPIVLGHESSGIVRAVGPDVKNLSVGDNVTLEPGASCRTCVRCKEGRYNLCPKMVFAAAPPYNGTLARLYRLPADLCYKLPESVPLQHGALAEPLSVAVHLARTQAQISHGDSVVVFGVGPIGLLCCAVARFLGARIIVAVDINPDRLSFALDTLAVATHTFLSEACSPKDNAGKIIAKSDMPSLGADVAIDASGAGQSIQTAIHVLRPGGTFVQGGMGNPIVDFPITEVCVKELNVKGSFRYGPGDYDFAIGLLAEGHIKADLLITKTVKFEDAEQAFEDSKAARGIKIMIKGPE